MMHRDIQTELARRFFSYLNEKTTHYANGTMEIPADSYFDRSHNDRERDRVFMTRPIVIGCSSEMAEPGDYVSRELIGSPVLVVRQEDGRLKAFSNVCRHRGAKVAAEGMGCTSKFKCPYHAWTYNIDGSLKNIPFPEGFEELDRSELGLVELPCDERHGLVWVVLTPGEPLDIAAEIGADMDRQLGAFELEKYHLVREAHYEEDMNWKVIADGFLDPYHLQFVHPNTVGPFFNTNVYTLDVLGPNAARLIVSRKSMHDVKHEDPETVDLMPHIISNYILLPNTFVTVEPYHFEIWTICPHATDPEKCTASIRFLLRDLPETEKGERYLNKNWELLIHTVVDEDWGVGRDLQKGLSQGRVERTVAGRNEAPIQFVHGNLAALVTGDDGEAMAPADEPYPRTYGNLVGEAT